MEVYILDSLLRRNTVVDVYESLIWTERFAAYGDFELVLNSTPATRSLFVPGVRIAQNDSYRVMTVETVEDNTDSEGKSLLTVKGRSLEAILENRVAKKTMSKLVADTADTPPEWVITGTPSQVMTTLFDTIVRNGTLDAGDKIPFLQPGTIFGNDTIPLPIDPIKWTQELDTLYNALTAVAEPYGLGFRLVRNFDTSQLYFDVYTGSDRTTGQSVLAPVVFAPNLENLQNTTTFTTIDKAKNVAYVYSTQGFLVVYAPDVDPSIDGFDRNVLLVKATDLPTSPTPTADEINASLTQQGREALLQSRGYSAFDGEIGQRVQYKYGTHYNLGDLVEMRNTDGVANDMRVTEQIFVSDKEGERSYPTLTIYQFVGTGSWLSWESNKVWADFENDPITWSELP